MSDSLAQQLSNDLASAASNRARACVLLRGRRRTRRQRHGRSMRSRSSSPTISSMQTTRSARAPPTARSPRASSDAMPAPTWRCFTSEGATLTPVTFATDAVRVGEIVLAAGRTWTGLVAHPGFVTHLSGPHQVSPGFRLDQAIHTSLDPFSGFSGGALVNVRGEVVGISTSALDRGRGLAIPARDVTRVVDSLRRHGRLRRGYLGISSLPVALPERQRQGCRRTRPARHLDRAGQPGRQRAGARRRRDPGDRRDRRAAAGRSGRLSQRGSRRSARGAARAARDEPGATRCHHWGTEPQT